MAEITVPTQVSFSTLSLQVIQGDLLHGRELHIYSRSSKCHRDDAKICLHEPQPQTV